MTKFENELSASCVIKGGVPQGSRIGPIAFVVHMNRLNSILNDSDKNDHRSGTNEEKADGSKVSAYRNPLACIFHTA